MWLKSTQVKSSWIWVNSHWYDSSWVKLNLSQLTLSHVELELTYVESSWTWVRKSDLSWVKRQPCYLCDLRLLCVRSHSNYGVGTRGAADQIIQRRHWQGLCGAGAIGYIKPWGVQNGSGGLGDETLHDRSVSYVSFPCQMACHIPSFNCSVVPS